MAHPSYDLQNTAYGGREWRANFFPTVRSPLREHDPDGDATNAQEALEPPGFVVLEVMLQRVQPTL
jgi:hypothetical protein